MLLSHLIVTITEIQQIKIKEDEKKNVGALGRS
jgi:hypothetical protein